MEIQKKNENKNPALSRTEYEFRVKFDGAVPTKDQVQKEVAKSLKVDENLCIVRKVSPGFKTKEASSTIYVYNDQNEKDRIENYLMHKKIREKIEKQKEEERKRQEEQKQKEEEQKQQESQEEQSEGEQQEASQEEQSEGSSEEPQEQSEQSQEESQGEDQSGSEDTKQESQEQSENKEG